MEHDDQQNKTTYSSKGAWIGFIAYLVLILMIAAIYIF
jgi:hypothetical protein